MLINSGDSINSVLERGDSETVSRNPGIPASCEHFQGGLVL
jgi:hypothetical protein